MPGDAAGPRIVESRPATAEEWRAFHEASQHATFFEGPAWAEIWDRYTGGRIAPAPRLFTFDDGAMVLAPWSRQRRRLGRSRVLAAPGGTFGGGLYEPGAGVTPGHMAALFRQLGPGPVIVRQNPFDPLMGAVSPPGGWSRPDFTQVLSLAEFEAADRALRQNQVYRKRRQGERAGLSLRPAVGPEDVGRYYAVYLAARARWGEEASSRYGRGLFAAIDLGSENVDFWMIERAGDVIGGGPFLKAGSRHVVSWLMVAHPDHFDARPYDFAYTELIHHYRDRGFRWFDFNPSGGHEGVVSFKENFGTTRRASNVYERRPAVARLVAALRNLAGGWASGE